MTPCCLTLHRCFKLLCCFNLQGITITQTKTRPTHFRGNGRSVCPEETQNNARKWRCVCTEVTQFGCYERAQTPVFLRSGFVLGQQRKVESLSNKSRKLQVVMICRHVLRGGAVSVLFCEFLLSDSGGTQY